MKVFVVLLILIILTLKNIVVEYRANYEILFLNYGKNANKCFQI